MSRANEKHSENGTKGSVVKVLCADCGRGTNHIVLVSAEASGREPYDRDIFTSWTDDYQVIRCQGCDRTSFRHVHWFSEHENHDLGHDGESETLYPERMTKSKRPVRGYRQAPSQVVRIYRETIEAYNRTCYTLCAAGLRALVEGICAERTIKNGPIEQPDGNGGFKILKSSRLDGKINGLREKGVITQEHANALHEQRFLGNHAVHELESPPRKSLSLAIDIIEHTLDALYEMPRKAMDLKGARVNAKVKP